MKKIVELEDATVQVNNDLDKVKTIPDDVNLTIYERDLLTISGGNGAGKLTLFNVIAGILMLTGGSAYIPDKDVTYSPAEKRTNYLARIFQDLKMGTAPRMTMAENLLITKYHGEKRGLLPRKIHAFINEFQALVARTGNGLEKHLETPTGFLPGGQCQALSLLMATLKRPELSLFDEHTAALDPEANMFLVNLTGEFVTGDHLTALTIIHHMEDVLKYGNRLTVTKSGKIIKDLNQDEKA